MSILCAVAVAVAVAAFCDCRSCRSRRRRRPAAEMTVGSSTEVVAADGAVEHISPACPATYRKLSSSEGDCDGNAGQPTFAVDRFCHGLELRMCAYSGHRALHAAADFRPGDVVAAFSHRALLPQPNYLTLQVDDDSHILLAPRQLESLNHSCDPNVFLDTEAMRMECVRPITAGDEITFFYPSTEWDMNSAFDCLCGASGQALCLRSVRGAKYLTSEQRRRGGYRFNAHITRKLAAADAATAEAARQTTAADN